MKINTLKEKVSSKKILIGGNEYILSVATKLNDINYYENVLIKEMAFKQNAVSS